LGAESKEPPPSLRGIRRTAQKSGSRAAALQTGLAFGFERAKKQPPEKAAHVDST